MGDKQIVVAIFPDEAAADTAAQSLKDWDKLDDDVKLNTIGILVLDEKGKVKTQKIGRRSWGKGAGIGVVLAALTPPTLLAGASPGVCSEGSTTKDSGSTAPSETRSPMRDERPGRGRGPRLGDRGVRGLRQAHRARGRAPRAEPQ